MNIKSTKPYYWLRSIKRNMNKNDEDLLKSIKNTKVFTTLNYSKIFKRIKPKDYGVGNFYYYLDNGVQLCPKKLILGNMSVDYSIVLDDSIDKSKEIYRIVEDYVNRIGDDRIKIDTTPRNLAEALQHILFWNSLLWQTGHKLNGLGRLDLILSRYEIPEDAEDVICNFLKTLHKQYKYKSNIISGDTGQIIILGGLNKDGDYFCNEYTYLFIKCLAKVHLPDPKILLRVCSHTPEDLLQLAMKCESTGIGSPLFSNDDVIIPKLIDFGYETEDAYNYAVSACWEPSVFGKSFDQNNMGNIEYGRCINQTILSDKFLNASSIEEIKDIFYGFLSDNIDKLLKKMDDSVWERDELLSLLMGLDIDVSEGGAEYNNFGLTSVGMSAAVDSLVNIDRYVFKEHKYSLKQIQDIIASNYEKNNVEFSEKNNGFGTDNELVIKLTNQIIHFTEQKLSNYRNCFGGKVKFGLSSPSYIDIATNVGATLDGRRAGEPFETHISRNKGEPLTEIMNFESKLQFSGISSNANVLDVMVQSSLIKDNIDKFTQYIVGGIKEGIFQLQMNVLSYAQLVDAKKYPEKYPNLIVRVWGFSAYFNDLPEEYKDNLIRRAKQMEMIA